MMWRDSGNMASQFIPYRKLSELRKAADGGDSKARNIVDRYMDRNADMETISRLMDDYYGVSSSKEKEVEKETPTPVKEVEKETVDIVPTGKEEKPSVDKEEKSSSLSTEDDFSDLSKELDGLIDLPSIEPTSFREYVSSKEKSRRAAKKDANYFKAFDSERRKAFLEKSKKDFSDSLNGKRRDLERSYGDISSALDIYGQYVSDMPEDYVQLDILSSSKAYGDLVDNDNAMSSFGRGWDEKDLSEMKSELSELVSKYGKKNVVAMLNSLREDGNSWRDYGNSSIDSAVSNYGKALDKLLK